MSVLPVSDPAVIDVLETPADFVRWAATRFSEADLAFGHGLDNALDEAYYLVRHTLNLPHGVPEVYLKARLLPQERRQVAACIQARIDERQPTAYLTGEAWFCGLRFRVDERVIVPRSPLAELIGDGFEPWLPHPPGRILDLCAGSGCIAIASAMVFPEAEVHAVEIDAGAAELMFANIADHGMEDRVFGHVGDLYAPLAAAGEPAFDLIVTNPPYVPESEWADLPAEYHAEPKVALAAGEDGMEVVWRLLREAPQWLAEDGVLVGEIGASTAEFHARFPGLPAHWPEFEFGGSGVFIIERAALVDWLAQQQGRSMSGNTLGKSFCVTSFGESHGPAIGCVIDGCPPGLTLSEADIQPSLDRRRPGRSKYVTQRKEADQVRILSGVFEGKTTGTPIALLIENTDQRSYDYEKIAQVFRPNHADYAYMQKYGRRDHRGGGRSSARETAVRVAAGAVASKYLHERLGVRTRACLTRVGEIELAIKDWEAVENNSFFCADPDRIPELEAYIDRLRSEGDSAGACLQVEAEGIPPGLGEPVYDRLDADIAWALMGINAVKGVEMGDGMAVAAMRGTAHRDEMRSDGFLSNHSGGVAGGISTGQNIVARLAIKPTSSITTPGQSIDEHGEDVEMRTTGRHDPCVGIRAVPIAEAMVSLIVMDHWLRHRAQCADVEPATPRIAARSPSTDE